MIPKGATKNLEHQKNSETKLDFLRALEFFYFYSVTDSKQRIDGRLMTK